MLKFILKFLKIIMIHRKIVLIDLHLKIHQVNKHYFQLTTSELNLNVILKGSSITVPMKMTMNKVHDGFPIMIIMRVNFLIMVYLGKIFLFKILHLEFPNI